MTRLTNAHSKKWENQEAMLALWYCAYNFTRVHSTLKTTPAVAAGLATETWSIERLLTEVAKVEREAATLNYKHERPWHSPRPFLVESRIEWLCSTLVGSKIDVKLSWSVELP